MLIQLYNSTALNSAYSKQIKAVHYLPNRRYTPRSIRGSNLRSYHIDIRWRTRYPWLEMALHCRRARNCRGKPDRPLDSTRLPHSSRGLSPEERKLSQQRLLEDGIADQGDSKDQNISIFVLLFKALSNWQTWVLIPGYMTISGAGAISYFYPTLIHEMGYTSTAAQYMTAPLYIASLAAAIPISWLADRKPHARAQLLMGDMIVGMVFFALIAGIRNNTARYLFLCFISMTFWTGSALALSFSPTSLAS